MLCMKIITGMLMRSAVFTMISHDVLRAVPLGVMAGVGHLRRRLSRIADHAGLTCLLCQRRCLSDRTWVGWSGFFALLVFVSVHENEHFSDFARFFQFDSEAALTSSESVVLTTLGTMFSMTKH
jgi:hypothetical protein